MSVLEMSVQAGMLILVIMLVRAAARNRLPKTGFLIMWGLVLLRMLVPFSLPSKWSILGVFQTLTNHTGRNAVLLDGSIMVELSQSNFEAAAKTAAVTNFPLAGIWLGGALILFVVFFLLIGKSYAKLRFSLPIRGNCFVDSWLARHKLLRPLRVLQSDRISTPLAVGLIRPRIILPKTMDMSDARLLHDVLSHEYCHIRRFDMLWKLLALLAVCVHWFNPLAWLLPALIDRDLELTCDEMVICGLNAEERRAYARSLVAMAEGRQKTSLLSSAFCRNSVKERMVSVMKYKKASAFALILSAVLITGLAVVFASSPKTKGMPQDIAQPTDEENIVYGEPVKGVRVKGCDTVGFASEQIDCANGLAPAHREKNGQMAVYTNNGGTWTLSEGQKAEITFDTKLVEGFESSGQGIWFGYVKNGEYVRWEEEGQRYMLLNTTVIPFAAPETGEYCFFFANMSSDSIYVNSVSVTVE